LIIRLFLKLFFAALFVLIIADVFYELHLRYFATLILKLGDDILLLSFALLLVSGMMVFSKQIAESLKRYFSTTERAQRRAFFSIAQHRYLQKLFASKKQQILYFSTLKKQAILTKNDKKQSDLLAKSLLKELQLRKTLLSKTEFNDYKQAIKQAAAQQKMQCLLDLQQNISAFK
jgi:hypothetical protein